MIWWILQQFLTLPNHCSSPFPSFFASRRVCRRHFASRTARATRNSFPGCQSSRPTRARCTTKRADIEIVWSDSVGHTWGFWRKNKHALETSKSYSWSYCELRPFGDDFSSLPSFLIIGFHGLPHFRRPGILWSACGLVFQLRCPGSLPALRAVFLCFFNATCPYCAEFVANMFHMFPLWSGKKTPPCW